MCSLLAEDLQKAFYKNSLSSQVLTTTIKNSPALESLTEAPFGNFEKTFLCADHSKMIRLKIDQQCLLYKLC